MLHRVLIIVMLGVWASSFNIVTLLASSILGISKCHKFKSGYMLKSNMVKGSLETNF
jgi:hypothetical protein